MTTRNNLLEPIAIGSIDLQNRIVMAPMTRNRADVNGVPSLYAASYYGQRAEAGLIISEGTQPSAAGQGYPRTSGFIRRSRSPASERLPKKSIGEEAGL